MLDDFRKSSTANQSRQRFGTSFMMSLALCGAGSAAIVHATAGVHAKEEEKLEAVEFAPPPEPPPPAEVAPPPEPSKPKPKIKKAPKLEVPKELSKEVLKESDAALTDAGDVGPVDGNANGAPAPPPPPPPKKAGPVVKPVDSGSNRYDRLKYPPAAQRKGIEGAVIVMFDVMETGSVANAHIVSGPSEFHETVLKAAATWRFTPAKQDGQPIRYKGMTKRVLFRLEDA